MKGLLLMRVRDELKMTIAAYQTLYQSSVTFGMRKQLQSEQGKSELESRIQELEQKKQKFEEKVHPSNIDSKENRIAEQEGCSGEEDQGEVGD